MYWLMNNTIADMYGPYFLILYACVIVLTLTGCWWTLRLLDWTKSLPLLSVPSNPDPYEIAYLRGGENELIRSVIFSLVQRGYLRVSHQASGSLISPASQVFEQHNLTPLERRVSDWFTTSHKVESIFRPSALPTQIKPFSTTYEQRLRRENMLTPTELRGTAAAVLFVGALVITALGGYKLFTALSEGRTNVAFLVMMGVISLVILFKICRPPRLSRRGRTYLKKLQLAFERLKTRGVGATQAFGSPATFAAADPTALLVVGLFGVSALSGTAYDDYHQAFRRSAADGGSSGASCGSSSSDSGDGGGSGCGGGGCGGCGS
ncbi:MAG TPA: TIGR04222 domain-containing membrane protein [Pyrinomonadaceae bacterium]|nr:TIGR04222 domain-containing membrane protein [Pyrinomonadaceae bacterium]